MATEAELLQKIEALEAELRRRSDEHEAEMILDLVMRQMPAIYWMVDRDLRLLRTGGAIQKILGYDQSHYIGRTLHEAIAEDRSTADTIALHTRAVAGETIQYESEYRGKVLATVIGPYRSGSGESIGAIGSCIDVTSWRALEGRMVDAQRAESLGVLAGGLAHDFNNLLAAVIGNADIALRELAEGKLDRHALEDIRTAGLRAAELTEQLLAYAGRGGAGTSRVEPSAVLEELTRILAPSIPRGVNITIDVPRKLAVRSDPAQFRQVLINLIANARDALRSNGGAITIRAQAQHMAGEPHPDDILTPLAGSYVVLEVQDNGPGMDAETRRHVFEPFFTTKATGHGLGLAAVLGIVRAHGGGIRLTSAPAAGATFQVLWPAAATAPLRVPTQPPIDAPTVLVIDDEDLVRDVLARMVEDLGYAALTAADGQTGLELVDQNEVAAVLVDLSMPQMSGADVVAALRTRRPGLPVVVCSGYDREGKRPVQADAYLAKPFRIDVLERTLAKLLPLRSV